jgi:predicted peptidase
MSMGGYGTWEALMRQPQRWAAAVPICGGGDPARVEAYKDIPIWVWHGANDTTVLPAN